MKLLDHLKALWHMPDRLASIEAEIYRVEPTLSGVRLSELERQMIREVHNLITVRLDGYLKAENERISAEATERIKARSSIIIEKGEKLDPKVDFDD